ncbi:phosphate acyltransferase PlsX [candidate division KSB1 bacterium]|nr:phosphate acyltransferase PlsX [candidate division KSB1 bacterium]
MIKIALDAMGGDNAPHDVVHGGIEAARISKGRFEVVLVGDQNLIEKEIARHFRIIDLPFSIVHAADAVAMDAQPSQALKQKESSIAVAFRLHKDNNVSAVVSAGNTGAVMATALMQLKRIQSIRRPAIGMLVPSETGKTLLLDVGANVDSRPGDLLQFGIMGSIFYSHVFNKEQPSVGLLSVGHESVKGNEVTLKAHEMFRNSNINFIGNIEGGDIVRGNVDIVVCDGFVGNVLLKFAESFHGFFKANMRIFIRKYLFSKIGALLMKPTFEGIRKAFDYQEYGGAPLLGVQGYCIIAHGRSTPRAIKNAILAAHKTVVENVAGHILKGVEQLAIS